MFDLIKAATPVWQAMNTAPRVGLIAVAAMMLTAAAGLPALAQKPPYVYPLALGTSSVAILAENPSRKKLIFHNPNDSAKVAVCPVGPNRKANSGGSNVVAVINGPGCMTILPYGDKEISGSTGSGPQQTMDSAWVGIASAGGSYLTVYEFE